MGCFPAKRDAHSQQGTSLSAGAKGGCFPKKRDAARELPSFYSMSDVEKHLDSLMDVRPGREALYFYWRSRTRRRDSYSSNDLHVLEQMEEQLHLRLRALQLCHSPTQKIQCNQLYIFQNVINKYPGGWPLGCLSPRLKSQLTAEMGREIREFQETRSEDPEIIFSFIDRLLDASYYFEMVNFGYDESLFPSLFSSFLYPIPDYA